MLCALCFLYITCIRYTCTRRYDCDVGMRSGNKLETVRPVARPKMDVPFDAASRHLAGKCVRWLRRATRSANTLVSSNGTKAKTGSPFASLARSLSWPRRCSRVHQTIAISRVWLPLRLMRSCCRLRRRRTRKHAEEWRIASKIVARMCIRSVILWWRFIQSESKKPV